MAENRSIYWERDNIVIPVNVTGMNVGDSKETSVSYSFIKKLKNEKTFTFAVTDGDSTYYTDNYTISDDSDSIVIDGKYAIENSAITKLDVSDGGEEPIVVVPTMQDIFDADSNQTITASSVELTLTDGNGELTLSTTDGVSLYESDADSGLDIAPNGYINFTGENQDDVKAQWKETLEIGEGGDTLFESGTGANSIKSVNAGEASGASSIAIGDNSNATHNSTIAIGVLSSATGMYSSAIGRGNSASGNYAVVYGIANAVNGHTNATLIGDYLTAGAHNQTIIGRYNTMVNAENRFIVGLGGGSATRKTVFQINGEGSLITANNNVVLLTALDRISNNGISANISGYVQHSMASAVSIVTEITSIPRVAGTFHYAIGATTVKWRDLPQSDFIGNVFVSWYRGNTDANATAAKNLTCIYTDPESGECEYYIGVIKSDDTITWKQITGTSDSGGSDIDASDFLATKSADSSETWDSILTKRHGGPYFMYLGDTSAPIQRDYNAYCIMFSHEWSTTVEVFQYCVIPEYSASGDLKIFSRKCTSYDSGATFTEKEQWKTHGETKTRIEVTANRADFYSWLQDYAGVDIISSDARSGYEGEYELHGTHEYAFRDLPKSAKVNDGNGWHYRLSFKIRYYAGQNWVVDLKCEFFDKYGNYDLWTGAYDKNSKDVNWTLVNTTP